MRDRFPTDYISVLQLIDNIDPIEYCKSRNYVDGAVTGLSPYISRGVISTKQVLDAVLAKGHRHKDIEQFVKELCWRDYFQRVAQHKDLNRDIRQPQSPVADSGIPVAILDANTGIEGIDRSIRELYETGYMHNHCRMYTASLVCNLADSHWHNPAQWMYYHLLDGDWASNACSWQWVAGANSSKKYYANQENINRYTHTRQSGTFLDVTYEALENLPTPQVLMNYKRFDARTQLPAPSEIQIDTALPTFIYNYYNLDPLWHSGEAGNRILLLEPEFFSKYPVSEHCIRFILDLSRNIKGIQVYVGSFAELVKSNGLTTVRFKEHPLNIGYTGTEDARDWIVDRVTSYFPSFFGYWKKVERELLQMSR